MSSKVVEVPGDRVPFSLEPILVELEGYHYIGPILPVYLADLGAGRRLAGGGAPKSGGGGSNSGGGRNKKNFLRGMSQGDLHECGRAMMRTCLPCPFGMGRTHGQF